MNPYKQHKIHAVYLTRLFRKPSERPMVPIRREQVEWRREEYEKHRRRNNG